MQYRFPPASLGPSSNTCPKWLLQFLQYTSVRCMPWLSSDLVPTFSATAGSVNDGQPEPESNFLSDENRAAPQARQWYIPSSWLSTYFPEKGASVPLSRSTWYSSGVSFSFSFSSFIWEGYHYARMWGHATLHASGHHPGAGQKREAL